MGMDVMGKAATSEVGEYFRRSVWGWHPLWTYVEDAHPEYASKVQYGHSNDGDGLGASDAAALGNLLALDVKRGTVKQYVKERDAALKALPMETCAYCKGTGVRTDEVGVKMRQHLRETRTTDATGTEVVKIGWCNGCDGLGLKKQWATSYSLEVEDVREFATFLRECGGFEIC